MDRFPARRPGHEQRRPQTAVRQKLASNALMSSYFCGLAEWGEFVGIFPRTVKSGWIIRAGDNVAARIDRRKDVCAKLAPRPRRPKSEDAQRPAVTRHRRTRDETPWRQD